MDVKGLSCQVCDRYLTEEDDVVFCPVCGAPYHRECYEKEGKCVFEEKHGTSEQYQPPKRVTAQDIEERIAKSKYVCFNCGHEFAEDEKYCPHCRTPRGLTEGMSFTDDSFGGVDPDKMDSDGVTAKIVRAFTLINTRRYVPKYFKLNKNSKASWNWAAFLLPQGWFFYRKMYKPGIIAILLMIISAVCLIPFNALIVVPEDIKNYYELVPIFMKAWQQAGPFVHTMAYLSAAIDIATRVFCGVFGDYIYKTFTKNKLVNYKPDEAQAHIPLEIRLSRLGGIQPFMFLVGYWATALIPQLIEFFIV